MIDNNNFTYNIDKDKIISEIKEAEKPNINEILEELKKGIKELSESERYKKFLEFKSSLYKYSLNNCFLILMQKPDATYVGSYNFWKQSNRHVKKGEKGIKILAPITKKIVDQIPVLDENKNPIIDENGNAKTEEKERFAIVGFKFVHVFDISQTEGLPIPDILKTLSGNSTKSDKLIDVIKSIYPKIKFEKIEDGSKGYYDLTTKYIVVKEGMSKDHTVKTLIHEYAHSKLHNTLLIKRHEAEVQAESVAYVVLKHFGLDTSEYSFGYIKGWAGDKNIDEFENALKIISETSAEIIDEINLKLNEEYEKYKANEINAIKNELIKNGFKATEKILDNIFMLNNMYGKRSLKEISQAYKNLQKFKGSDEEKNLIKNIGDELKEYEKQLKTKKKGIEMEM